MSARRQVMVERLTAEIDKRVAVLRGLTQDVLAQRQEHGRLEGVHAVCTRTLVENRETEKVRCS